MSNVFRRSNLLPLLALATLFFVATSSAVATRHESKLVDASDLEVPKGHKLAFTAYAEGFQKYRWNGTGWDFVAPEALLYADEDSWFPFGYHYEGPTWESLFGSSVVGSVLERYTADPKSIPWLLLEAVDNDGPGIFARVTYIQRLHTAGGLAPSRKGKHVGELVRVPYTADYYFYYARR